MILLISMLVQRHAPNQHQEVCHHLMSFFLYSADYVWDFLKKIWPIDLRFHSQQFHITWINFLYFKFKELNIWPSRAQVDAFMPRCFQAYPDTRCIIDATEIFIQQPSSPIALQLTFSSYKNHNTLKGLVGITPSGAVCFISDLFGGNISDRELTTRCGIIDLLDPGDSVMADKGFTIADLLEPKGVALNIPSMKTQDQFEEHEVVETRRIASVRIHVERAIGNLKNFHIFHSIPNCMAGLANQIFFVCTIFTNFKKPHHQSEVGKGKGEGVITTKKKLVKHGTGKELVSKL